MPTVNNVRPLPMRNHPLNLSAEEWHEIHNRYPDLNCQSFWREWVEWIEKSPEKRNPKEKMGAFIGFLTKKREAIKTARAAGT